MRMDNRGPATASLLVLAACGDNHPPPPDASTACDATFTGNFAEQSSSDEACPTLDGGTLHLELPVAALESALKLDIDLGTPTIGLYSSRSVTRWSAFALHKIGNQACAYSAGADAVPEGAFELALDSIGPLHGALTLDLAVLTFPNSECGDLDTEHLELGF